MGKFLPNSKFKRGFDSSLIKVRGRGTSSFFKGGRAILKSLAILMPILHYVLGLRFGSLKHSKMREKTQQAHIFTQRIV